VRQGAYPSTGTSLSTSNNRLGLKKLATDKHDNSFNLSVRDEEKTVFIIFLLGSFYKTFLNKISAEIEVNREASAKVTPFFASITPRKKFYKTDARLKEKMVSRN